jgi:DNA-directed RNA polymerase specialized sigma24 family protein
MEISEELLRRYQSSTNKTERDAIVEIICNLCGDIPERAIRRANASLSKAEIKDVEQEVWIMVVEQLDQLHWRSKSEFYGWIYTIAFRQGLKSRRNKELYSIDDLELILDNSGSENAEDNEKFWQLWIKFDREGYIMNYLFYIDEKTDKEIADFYGISAEAARKRRTRFLNTLGKNITSLQLKIG